MKKNWLLVSLLLSALLTLGVGCSSDDDDDDDNGTDPGTDTSDVALLNASSYDDYASLNLATGDTLSMTASELEASDDWHVAFRRYHARTNVKGVDLTARDSTVTDFESVAAVPGDLAAEDWVEEGPRYVVEDWYNYTGPPAHAVIGNRRPFVIRTADGKYGKFAFVDTAHSDGMGLIADATIIYHLNEAGGMTFSGDPDTMLVADENDDNQIFVSFSDGGTVQVSDPMSSDAWDIMLEGFTVKINGGISGNGGVGIYPIYQEESEYDEIAEAPSDMGAGYQQDVMVSVMSDWWDYQENHQLASTGHIYLLRTGAEPYTYYKVEVLSYYNPENARSGWVSLRYEEIQE